MKSEIYGYITVVGAASMWGIGGAVAKALFNQEVSPFVLVKIRLLLAALLLVAGLLVYDRRLLRISRQDIPYFMKLGVLGMAMLQFFYFLTISLTNVATAVFLQDLSPVLVALYTVIWQKASLSWRQVTAIGIALLGGAMIMAEAGGAQGLTIAGALAGVATAAAAAFNIIYVKRGIASYRPITMLTYSCMFGAAFWWLAAPGGSEISAANFAQWPMFLYIVVFSTIIPFLLFYIGIRYLTPTDVSITSSLEPVVAAAAAYAALGEAMSSLQIVGGILVLMAVIMLQYSSDRPVEAAEPQAKQN